MLDCAVQYGSYWLCVVIENELKIEFVSCTSPISSARQPPVARGWHIGQHKCRSPSADRVLLHNTAPRSRGGSSEGQPRGWGKSDHRLGT